ncbi:hypothetical protein E4U57_001814 [Claviceps arundinis]|uniref:Uncharacterized protein n=1 Tax=Claviceps arundinis TaxID=1623583 RepID=A0ABQ7PKT5_9HYPO|nr:hypothetical protein E4U57_001814 [Claviceps arundinis]
MPLLRFRYYGFKHKVPFEYNPRFSAKDEMNRMCEFFGWQRGGAKEVRARTRLRQVKLDRRSWFEPKYSDKGDNVLDVLQQPECQRLDTSPVLETSEQIDAAVSCPIVSTSGPTIAASEHINLSASCPVVEMSGPIDLFFNRVTSPTVIRIVWSAFRRLCSFFGWLKKAIKGVYVKIVDFIDSERTGEPTHKFASLAHLRRYTENNGEVFPREQAKGSLLLRFLLQVLFGRKRGQ